MAKTVKSSQTPLHLATLTQSQKKRAFAKHCYIFRMLCKDHSDSLLFSLKFTPTTHSFFFLSKSCSVTVIDCPPIPKHLHRLDLPFPWHPGYRTGNTSTWIHQLQPQKDEEFPAISALPHVQQILQQTCYGAGEMLGAKRKKTYYHGTIQNNHTVNSQNIKLSC